MKPPGTPCSPPGTSGDISPYATSKEMVRYMAAKDDELSCDYAAVEKKAAAVNSEAEDAGRNGASENTYVLHSYM